MAQAKTIQLLRSSSVYTSAENARQLVGKMTGQDGEIRIARYNAAAQGEDEKIQSMLCIYHAAPQLPDGKAAGWTFIEDVSNNADSPAALKELIESVIGGVGLEDDGSYTGYTNDDVVGTTTTLKGTVDEIIDYIKNELDVDARTNATTDGKVVVTVSQTDGKVTETPADLTDVKMGGYSKTSDTGAIAATDTLEQAFSKVENAITSATVKSTDKTVNITDNSGKDLSVNIDGTTLIKNATSGVISSDLTIRKETTGLDTNVKEQYKLVYGSSTTAIGEVIKVYKDSSLKSVALNGQNLNFTYILADGTESTVSVDVSTFLAESEFKDGLQVNNGEVSVKVGDGIEYGPETSDKKSIKVKIDETSESFLTVGSGGVKLSGVQTAITNAINALDVTTDAAVAGQYVAAIEQTDGVVAVKTRANVADAVLTGYDKGSSAPQSTAVTATDDVKTAISKLEWQVAAANAGVEALDATVNSTGGTNVAVQVVEEDGVITAVNVTTDNTINLTDLNNKIATLDADLNASGTAEHDGTFVMSGVTEVDGVITSVDSVEVEAAGAAAAVKATIDAYKVNNKAISTNPVLGGSDIALTGYAKGSDGTAVSASDSVNVAIGKLENQVDAAKAAATAAHSEVVSPSGNTHVTVSASQTDSTTGKVTYTVNETNIADADDLTAEIAARKAVDGQSGDTYTANTGVNYIASAESLNNADVLLDAALKTADDAMLTQINGSNAIEVSAKANKQQTVSLKLDTTTANGNITSDMLQITSNGLMMKDTWDCGTF